MLCLRNNMFPVHGPLHLLASLGKLDEFNLGLFTKFTNEGSLQRCSLSQMSNEGRTPFCEAILYGNMSFISAFLSS